jgi:alanyl-tRNA synthetase
MGTHHHDPIKFSEGIEGVRLYWDTKSMKTDFISDIREVNDNWINLKDNYFYPEGGGQPFDTGIIYSNENNSISYKIIEVQEFDGKVWVRTNKPIDNSVVNNSFICKIDKSRRLTLTRNHSGQHLLSAAFYELFEVDTDRAELNLNESQIDLVAKLSLDQIKDSMKLTMDKIAEDLPLETLLVKKKDFPKLKIRGDLKIDGNEIFRLVKIGETENPFDLNLCGGTHVASTQEIMAIAITKVEGKKIRFVTGLDSLHQLTNENMLTHYLTRELSISKNNILSNTISNLDRIKILEKENQKLVSELINLELAGKKWVKADSYKFKYLKLKHGNNKIISDLNLILKENSSIILEFPDQTVVIVSITEEISQVIMKKLRDNGIKGGGKGTLLMGKNTENLDISKILMNQST